MNFDEKAKNWDQDPKKIERAGTFAAEIKSFLSEKKLEDAMEFGSGTGLLSFFFKDYFKRITLVDSSKGMLDVAKEKIRQNNVDHFRVLNVDLEKEEINEKFDIIYSLMALHHIEDLDLVFHRFSAMLTEGGYLCIGDLEKEDGSFHSHMPDFNGHNGFERDKLERLLKLHGFSILEYKQFFTIKKENGSGQKAYPLFLMIVRKPEYNPHQ